MTIKGTVLQDFTTLQNVFLALDHQSRENIAGRIVAEMMDMDMLPAEHAPTDAAQKVRQVIHVLSRGIKIGTDAYKSDTETCRYAQLAKQIRIILHDQNIPLSVPYDKSSAQLAGAGPGSELIAQKQTQLRHNHAGGGHHGKNPGDAAGPYQGGFGAGIPTATAK